MRRRFHFSQNQRMTPPVSSFIAFIRVPSVQRALDFYQEALGLSIVLEQAGCVILRAASGACIGFCESPDTDPIGSRLVLTLVVDTDEEVDAWSRHCQSQGIRTDGPPRLNDRFGIHHFFAEDPFGHQVEVQAFHDPRWPG
jgi:catechol 2,3-dioxygenase-like lactoylglutathione lyase family enzyme